jgi:hypothetical protein
MITFFKTALAYIVSLPGRIIYAFSPKEPIVFSEPEPKILPEPKLFYFLFNIPDMPDGSVVHYSQGWCGTRNRCAKDETGIYYDDELKFGVGKAFDRFIPTDIVLIGADQVMQIMGRTDVADAKTESVIELGGEGTVSVDGKVVELAETVKPGVYFGKKLADRWNITEEAVLDGR